MCNGPGLIFASVKCVLYMSLMDNSSYSILRNWISPPDFLHNIFMSFCVNTSNLIYLIFTSENGSDLVMIIMVQNMRMLMKPLVVLFHGNIQYIQWNISNQKTETLKPKLFSLIIILLKCM